MTDLEFATCDLDRYNEIYAVKPKKFYELKIGDPIYCVRVDVRPASGLVRPIREFNKFQLQLFDMEMVDPRKPKARQVRVYLTSSRGFVADKNVSAFIKFKRQYRGENIAYVYGTLLSECIYKAEKTTGIRQLEDKLVWTEPRF
jgi:hypothetical protein